MRHLGSERNIKNWIILWISIEIHVHLHWKYIEMHIYWSGTDRNMYVSPGATNLLSWAKLNSRIWNLLLIAELYFFKSFFFFSTDDPELIQNFSLPTGYFLELLFLRTDLQMEHMYNLSLWLCFLSVPIKEDKTASPAAGKS